MRNQVLVAYVAAAALGTGVASAAELTDLGAVVVTASKREQTLADIPIAVSVTSAETVERAHIDDILDLHSVVPSLRTSQLQNSTQTNFLIRGFGNGANNPGIESSVGTFIDGVYRSRSASQIGDLVDVERIEVLRGPQSTLFGQNASAGVISVTTRKPSFTPTGSVEVGFGNYSAKQVRAGISAPITDRVAFSLSGNYNERDGYFRNLATGKGVNDRNRWDLRGQLLFNATDNLSFRLIADDGRIDELCCGVVNLQNGPTGAIINALGGKLIPASPSDRRGYFSYDPRNVVDNDGVSLQIDWKKGALTVSSITAKRNQKATDDYDSDFTSVDLLAKNLNSTHLDTFTQELRLAFDDGGAVTGLLGGYYFNEHVRYDDTLIWGSATRPYFDTLARGGISTLEAALGLPAGTFYGAGQGQVIDTRQGSDSYTLFGQLDWKLVDRLTLTAGVAYTQNKKDVAIAQTDTDVFASLDGSDALHPSLVNIGFAGAFTALTGGLPPTPANIGTHLAQAAQADAISVTACSATNPPPLCNSALGLYPLQILYPVTPLPNGHSNDSKTTYTARLAYQLSDRIKVYGGVSTGFKATSWNLSRDTLPFLPAAGFDRTAFGNVNPYYARYGTRYAGPEESTVYEIGLKGHWQHAAVNVAVFDEQIKGFQSNTFVGTAFELNNAGKESVKGAEVDVQYAPTPNWEFTVAGAYLDPKYDSYKGGVDGITDLTGTRPAAISSLTYVAAGTYQWTIANYSAYVRVDFDRESNVQVIENVPSNIAAREVSTVNASAGFATGGWDVRLWGHNLGNDNYLISAFPTPAQPGSYSGYPSQPRTFGVTVRKSF